MIEQSMVYNSQPLPIIILTSEALSLRVPLAHIHSTTCSFFPDETPDMIKRVFTPHQAPHTRRHFCGLCGSLLSHWSEETPEEAEWIYVNIACLRRDSMDLLEEAGVLPSVGSENKEMVQTATGGTKRAADIGEGREVRGTPWFEDMIQGSELGRIKRRKGVGANSDAHTTVEWEITECEGNEGDVAVTSTGKRKLGSLDQVDTTEMRSG